MPQINNLFSGSLEQQKFGILHTSGCLMVDVPHFNHLWDGQKDCPGDNQSIYGACEKYQETCLFACLWDPYGSLAML